MLVNALRQTWADVLLLDGKGELGIYRDVDNLTYLGPTQIDRWGDLLAEFSETLPARYQALLKRGLYEAPPDEPRHLIIGDEVQRGTRAKTTGKVVKDALSLIAEQSAALGDVLILASQRDVNAVPPDVRTNTNARLQMLGRGYFFYRADGFPTTSGRVAYLTAEESKGLLDQSLTEDVSLSPAYVPHLLGVQPVEPTRAPATLYLGLRGSGKTHALHHHPNQHNYRQLYVNFAQPHRAAIVSLIESAGAMAPTRSPIPDLAEIAALAIHAEPTLLLLDNLDQASPKALSSIQRLIAAAEAVALAATMPDTPEQRRKIDLFLSRCEVQEMKPLRTAEAQTLLWQNLDREAVRKPEVVERRILDEAGGNPKTIVDLARRVRRGDARELRTVYSPAPKINLSWLVLVAVISFAMIARWQVDSYTVAGILFAVALLLRPLLYRSLRREK